MFFTQTAGDTRKDGFLTAEVSVDSLFYKFTEGDAVYEFNSQAENPGALTFEDLKAVSVPLGKFFDMKFSPYDEVVAVEGEKLDWFRNYVVEQGRGYLDTATSFMWLDGISIERLKYITDVKKLIFPTEPQFIDSLWFSPFHFQIEGLNFSDTVGAKVTQVIDGYKTIEVKNIKLKPYPQTGRFYGIKGMLLSVESAKSNGSFMLSLTPKGSVRRAEGTFETELTSRVRKDKFTEKVSVNAVWELLGQFIN